MNVKPDEQKQEECDRKGKGEQGGEGDDPASQGEIAWLRHWWLGARSRAHPSPWTSIRRWVPYQYFFTSRSSLACSPSNRATCLLLALNAAESAGSSAKFQYPAIFGVFSSGSDSALKLALSLNQLLPRRPCPLPRQTITRMVRRHCATIGPRYSVPIARRRSIPCTHCQLIARPRDARIR